MWKHIANIQLASSFRFGFTGLFSVYLIPTKVTMGIFCCCQVGKRTLCTYHIHVCVETVFNMHTIITTFFPLAWTLLQNLTPLRFWQGWCLWQKHAVFLGTSRWMEFSVFCCVNHIWMPFPSVKIFCKNSEYLLSNHPGMDADTAHEGNNRNVLEKIDSYRNVLSITSLVRSNSPLKSVGEPVSSSGHATNFWQIKFKLFALLRLYFYSNSVDLMQHKFQYLQVSSPAQNNQATTGIWKFS